MKPSSKKHQFKCVLSKKGQRLLVLLCYENMRIFPVMRWDRLRLTLSCLTCVKRSEEKDFPRWDGPCFIIVLQRAIFISSVFWYYYHRPGFKLWPQSLSDPCCASSSLCVPLVLVSLLLTLKSSASFQHSSSPCMVAMTLRGFWPAFLWLTTYSCSGFFCFYCTLQPSSSSSYIFWCFLFLQFFCFWSCSSSSSSFLSQKSMMTCTDRWQWAELQSVV